MARKILIVSAEASGDLHASHLVRNLKNLNPGLEFFGLGGELSKREGVETAFDTSSLAVVGLVDVIKNIFAIKKIFSGLVKRIDEEKPCLAILVDYPGFNLALASQLKKRGIPVIYYISPQVWAWGEKRIETIKKCVTKVIVFFKFEEELYRRHGIDAEFVGHPLVETVKASLSKEEVIKKHGLAQGRPLVALLPGSRTGEVKALLPVMTGAAMIMEKGLPGAQFIIAKYRDFNAGLFDDALKDTRLDARVISGDTYNILGASDFAIVASGTATLETAIMGTPFIITYKASLINFLAYKLVAKIHFLGLVNIIAGKEIVPEFLQYDATAENLAGASLDIMRNGGKRSAMVEELKKVKDSLGSPGASERAAGAILPYVK